MKIENVIDNKNSFRQLVHPHNPVPMKNSDPVRATVAKSQKLRALLVLRGDSRIFMSVNPGSSGRTKSH